MSVFWEIICVSDGSRSGRLEQFLDYARADRKIKVEDLSGNFGDEAADSAGFYSARGQPVVIWTSICRIPRSPLTSMIEKWREGYEMVYATGIGSGSPFLRYWKS